MANWGAFSRDFAGAATKAFDSVSGAMDRSARTELLQNADKRAQRSADRADTEDAATQAYLDSEYGSGAETVAAKAAPSASGGRARAMGLPAPNKLGAVTETGEPVPASPDEAEQLEVADAQNTGYTPAPPAAMPTNSRAKYGDNPQSREPLEASTAESGVPYRGRITPKIAGLIEAKRARVLEQQNKDRDFSERKRMNDSTLESAELERQKTKQLLSAADYEQAKMKVADFSRTAISIADNVQASPDTPLSDPSIKPMVDKLVDTLDQGYDATPDGRSLKVTNNNGTYVVQTIEDSSGRVISTDSFKTWGDLKGATMMFGQIAQGDNLGKWMGAASLDGVRNSVRGTKGEAEISAFLDKAGNLSAAERLDPQVQTQLKADMKNLSARFPELTTETVKTPVLDDEGKPMFDANGRQVTQDVKRNKLAYSMDLLQPNTKIKLANGSEHDAQALVAQIIAKPSTALKAVGGKVEVLLQQTRQELIQGDIEPEVADYLLKDLATSLVVGAKKELYDSAAPKGIAVPAFNPRNPAMGTPRLDPTGQPIRNRAGLPLTN